MTVYDLIGTCIAIAFILIVIRAYWASPKTPFVITVDNRKSGIATRSVSNDAGDGGTDAQKVHAVKNVNTP